MANVGLRGVVERLRRGLADREADGELLERYVVHRDEDAFAELVARHGPRVYAVCRRVLGQHHLAEDAYQATFLVLAKKAGAVRPRAAVGGFLYGVARKAALRAYAVSRRHDERLVARVPDSRVATASTLDVDILAMLDEEIANLSEALRAAVVLCELDGASRADAARQLGIAEGTLSSRLAAARRQLARRLTARGAAFSGGLFAALASSALAAAPPALNGAGASVSAIAGGVMRTLLLAKLHVATALGVLVLAVAAVSVLPSTLPKAVAAPVPKEPADAGRIWVYNWKTGALAAYAPDGKVEREWKLAFGKYFLGMTPDGRKIATASTRDRVAGSLDNVPLTVFLRDVGEETKATDTGIPIERGDQVHWSSDLKRVVRVQVDRAKAAEPLPRFRNTVYDLDTKKATSLDVADDPQQVVGWGPDDKSFLTVKYSPGTRIGAVVNFQHHWHLFHLETKATKPLCKTHELLNLVLAPDGRSLFGSGQRTDGEDKPRWGMCRIDVGTGRAIEVAHHEDQGLASSSWSPNGKRVAYVWYGSKSEEEVRLVISDADGSNAKTVSIPTPAGDQREVTVLGWFSTKPKR